MAKKSKGRFVKMKCKKTGHILFVPVTPRKRRRNSTYKMVLRKYNPFLRAHTEYVEQK